MADNTLLPYTKDIIASDDIDGVKYQRMKLIYGDDGYNGGDVSNANPLPIINFAPSTATTSQINCTTTPVTILQSNLNRRGSIIINNSDNTMYLLFGEGLMTLDNWTLKIEKNERLFLGNGDFMGTIQAMWKNPIGTCNVTELT